MKALRLIAATRRGTSTLETGFSVLFLFGFCVVLMFIGAFYWAATTLSTTGDVAALSAQSAYDRIRFGPGVLDGTADAANQAQAAALARSAVDTVVDGAGDRGRGPFSFWDEDCGGPGASPIGRRLDPRDAASGTVATRTFTVTLRAPMAAWTRWDRPLGSGSCRTITSSLTSARLGR